MSYTANEYAGMSSGGVAGAGQSGGGWASRSEGAAQRAFAVSAAPLAGPAPTAMNQPLASQGSAQGSAQGPAQGLGQGQFSQPYTTGGPAGSAPGANGANRSTLGALIIRPLPTEVGAQTREVVLDGRDIAIGRSPACDVVLEGDQLVSRRHALLRATNGQYTIVDLGSSNGTFVNDTEIHQNTPLSDGDLITIGEHEVLYSTRAPSAAAPSPSASGSLGSGQEQRSPLASSAVPYMAQGAMPASELFDVAAAQTLLEPHEAQSAQRMEPVWAPPAPAQAQPTPFSLSAAQPQGQPPYQPAASFPTQAPYQPPAQPMQPPVQQPVQQAQAERYQQPFQSQPAQPVQAPAPYQPSYQPAASQPSAPIQATYGPPIRSGTTNNVRTTSTYLQAVRTQLDEANQRLAQAEEEESRLAEQRRAGLVEVRDRLSAILAEQRQGGYSVGAYGSGVYSSGSAYRGSAYGGAAASPTSANTAGLIALARQTEQSPLQIDVMMQLASRAGEIANALEAAQSRPASAGGATQGATQAPPALLAQLEALRARVDELLG